MKIARDGRYRGFFLFKKFSYAPFQIQLRDYTNSDALISPVLAHVSLSNDDGDGNENGKKAIGLDWQNNNFARASRFLSISLPSLHDYNVKFPNFTFYGGREHKTTTLFFFKFEVARTHF